MQHRLASLAMAGVIATCGSALGQEPPAPRPAPVLSTYGAGAGPVHEPAGTFKLLRPGVAGQNNTVAFGPARRGAFSSVGVHFTLRVLKGGDGGGIALLNAREFGAAGPAPFLRAWEAPSLAKSFGVGIDVYNPPTREPFGADGNVYNQPQREVSLHWDGREIVKRCAKEEFRGQAAESKIVLEYVPGGAEVTVQLGAAVVYDRYFVAGMQPYEFRLAAGARTGNVTTEFDLSNVRIRAERPITRRSRPLHVELFHHVMTDNQTTKYQAEVDLPPANWAYGRVLMTVQIHDGGDDWDEWDRNGDIALWDDAGNRRVIVPFITSYRTECHWVADVTPFRAWLAGKRKFEVAAGTTFYKGRGYLMSVSLDYYPGTPARDAFQVVSLWDGTAKYKSDDNHFRDFFTPREVAVPEGATEAEVIIFTTGHSQVGEFTPAKRTLRWTPAAGGAPEEFHHTLWRTDCYLNPNRPQYGTWKYARAGWAPGDLVRPWVSRLDAELLPGAVMQLEYLPQPYTFREGRRPGDKELAKAQHTVRAFLVFYRAPEALLDPPALLITDVQKGGAAAKAKIQRGDFFATYDGVPVRTREELRSALQAAAAAGKPTVKVTLFRNGKIIETELAPGRMGLSLRGR
jgi:hypothetical protein